MKHILIILLLFSSIGHSQTLEKYANSFKPNGFVNDYADLLNEQDETQLNQLIESIDQETSIQYGICIISNTNGYSIRELATEIGNQWGVGQEDKNNGIVVLLSKEDKQIFIATGLGTENYISENDLKILIEESIFPHLKSGKFYHGIRTGILGIQEKLAGTDLAENEEFSTIQIVLIVLAVLLVIAYMAFDYYKLGGFDPKVRMYGNVPWSKSRSSSSGGGSSSFGGGSFGGSGSGGSYD